MPATFELAALLVRPCGHIANIGVHGEPATLHLEELWIKNITITTGLVDAYSTSTLLDPPSYRRIADAASPSALSVTPAPSGAPATRRRSGTPGGGAGTTKGNAVMGVKTGSSSQAGGCLAFAATRTVAGS